MEMPEELPDFPLPPLPDIYDRELLRQVFTHTSYVGARKQSALFDKEAFHHDNEKLEHVGDALLGECDSIGWPLKEGEVELKSDSFVVRPLSDAVGRLHCDLSAS